MYTCHTQDRSLYKMKSGFEKGLLKALLNESDEIIKNINYKQNMPKKEILAQFKKRGFTFTEKEILEDYKKTYSINQTYLYYIKEKYQVSFDKLDDEYNRFNSDMIFYLLKRIIEENFVIDELPDPLYISETAQELYDGNDSKSTKIEKTYAIIKRALAFGKRNNKKKLYESFIQEGFDIAYFLELIYATLPSCKFKMDVIKRHMDILDELSKQYSESITEILSLKTHVLAAIVRTNDEVEIETYKNKLLKEYPKAPYQIYCAIISHLDANKNKQLCETYYTQCTSYKILNKDERRYSHTIHSRYDKFIHKTANVTKNASDKQQSYSSNTTHSKILLDEKVIVTYIKACVNLYGIVSEQEAIDIIYHYEHVKITRKELRKVFLKNFTNRTIVRNIHNMFYQSQIYDKDDVLLFYKDYKDKDFYLPEKREFLKYKSSQYYERTDDLEALSTYLLEHVKSKYSNFIHHILTNVVFSYQSSFDMSEIIEHIQSLDDGNYFNSIDHLNALLPYLIKIQNSTRLHSNRGFTPNESFQKNAIEKSQYIKTPFN